MWLGMAIDRHHPEKQDETDAGEDTGFSKGILAFAFPPTEKQGQQQTYWIENQQLIWQIFKRICP